MSDYRCISMDPPWNERGGGKIKRGADRHYPLVRTEDLPRVIYESGVFRPAGDSSHLWMWATASHLPDALWLMGALGFTYKTHSVWVKMKGARVQFGLGQYLRGSHELLLLGIRGKGQGEAWNRQRNVSSVVMAPRTRHSEKPPESIQMIEYVSAGPRLEMFARTPRDGWDTWGNEVIDE